MGQFALQLLEALPAIRVQIAVRERRMDGAARLGFVRAVVEAAMFGQGLYIGEGGL